MIKKESLASVLGRLHRAASRFLLAIVLCVTFVEKTAADEISLYDNKGKAVAYIDVEDALTIYLWAGKPVAYLHKTNVYGFNGQHLGWFEKGMIIDHDGNAVCVVEKAYPGYTSYEPYKSYKQYKPYKSYREYAPYRPHFSNRMSSTPCSIHLAQGAN